MLNVVLSDKIETLYLEWKDCYSDYSPKKDENIKNFIRGPGVRFLLVHYQYPQEGVPKNVDFSFLSTLDLRRYFPRLERVKAENVKEKAAYKVLRSYEPLCELILEWI